MLAAMLNKSLYVALRRPVDARRMAEFLEAHLLWAVSAERRGELFASGPFVAEGAAPGSAGAMSILRAGTEEEARAILAGDPFVESGAVAFELHCWMVMEGGFTVTVRFSDQSSRLI